MNYEDFLNTNQWELFRRAVWEHYEGRCQVCGGDGCDVHHLTYRYGLLNPRAVTLVCRPCHLIWSGQRPDHIPDTHPKKASLVRIAEIARMLGRDR